MYNIEETQKHLEKLIGIFNKQPIKESPEIRNQIMSQLESSILNPKFKCICTEIIENLKMSQ